MSFRMSYLCPMLSDSQKKMIRSLQQKKQREKHRLFVIEGDKIVSDLMHTGELNMENTLLICGSESWMDKWSGRTGELTKKMVVSASEEIGKLTSLQTPPDAIAVVRIPPTSFSYEILKKDITLVFDRIRDPGNLGTVIRTADWFGIGNIICSPDSVDNYNNKVVQASMGSVMHVNTHYQDLSDLFQHARRMNVPVYGTMMDGEDLFDTQVKTPALIVFGNESSGIEPGYEGFFRTKIRIPDHPPGMSGSESLNVASSVAVMCSELRRRQR